MDFDFGSREDQDRDIPTRAQASKSSANAADLLSLDDNNDNDHLMGGIGKPFLDDVDHLAGAAIGQDEEDILGDLSKPVEVVIANKVFLSFFPK